MSTTSRFTDGSGPFNSGTDNTDRIRNNQFLSLAPTGGTIGLKPFTSYTLVKLAMAFAPNLTIATGAALIGDKIDILYIGDATGRTVTYSNGISPVSATQVVAITKTSTASFQFDGTSWIETGRSQGI